MKKALFFLFVLFISMGLSAQQVNLASAITRAARAVEEVLPRNSKVAVLNFASTSVSFSDYVIEELAGELVNGKKVTIVDRRNLALITQELNLQVSGDVSDESAQAIGKMLGAQSIVSGTLSNMGTFYRFRIKAINVETAAIQTQLSLDLQNDSQVAFLLGGSPTNAQPVEPAASGGITPGTSVNDAVAQFADGITVPGNSLTEKLAWLTKSAESHNTYIITVDANETIEHYAFDFRGVINITIVLTGIGSNRNFRLRTHGTMFTVRSNVTFILDKNITLQGHNQNTGSMIRIESGIFKMNAGSAIIGNNRTGGEGGGVYMYYGTFEMNGGTISGNNAERGGGVFNYGGTFTMTGGTISGNTANRGGGVFHSGSSTFSMRSGIITGNTARERGGGVWMDSPLSKSGGTITGYNSDQNNGNVVKDTDGFIMARSGHAVFVNDNLRKETTAGPDVILTYGGNRGTTGGWDR